MITTNYTFEAIGRCTLSILVLYTTGNELVRTCMEKMTIEPTELCRKITAVPPENTSLQIIGLFLILWSILPIITKIIENIKKKKT